MRNGMTPTKTPSPLVLAPFLYGFTPINHPPWLPFFTKPPVQPAHSTLATSLRLGGLPYLHKLAPLEPESSRNGGGWVAESNPPKTGVGGTPGRGGREAERNPAMEPSEILVLARICRHRMLTRLRKN